MAITYTDNGGGAPNGSDLEFTYSFPVIQTEDVKVSLNGVTQATTKYTVDNVSNPTKITFNNTSVDSSVQNTSGAPKSGVRVRVYRETTVGKANGDEDPKAVFAAGSSIRAIDLNANQEQALFAIHELQSRPIETEDLQNLSITSDKIADGTIQEVDIANSAVTSNKIADNAVTTTEILNGAVTRDKLGADAVDGTKLADNAVDSEHYTDGSIDEAHLSASAVTENKIADGAVSYTKLASGSVIRAKIAGDAVDGTKIADDSINSEHIAAGALDNEHYATNSITSDKLSDATRVTSTEQATSTPNDTSFFTTAAAEARYFNASTGETIKNGQNFPDNDTTIATTAAINDRIIDLVDGVGGFVPVSNETSFPAANPDINNPPNGGTIVSVKAASEALPNGSTATLSGSTLTISNGRGTGSAVIITGAPSTIPSGFGFLVETTTTDHTYAFLRLVPKATEVTTVASKATEVTTVHNNITNINAVANNAANINAVAADATDIGAVAAKATEIGRLGTADAVADMAILGTADVVADMAILGTTDVVADLNTLGTADVVADLNTLGTADVVSDMNALATTNNITSMSTCKDNIASIVNCSTNISSVNTFGDQYQVDNNDPSTDGGGNQLAPGDLYFNTSANELKVYNGSAWQGGVTATGSFATVTGNTFTGDNRYNDGVKLKLGTHSDLEIFHDGNDSFIKDVGTGDLKICASLFAVNNAANNAAMLTATQGGAVELRHNNSPKLVTTSTGILLEDSSAETTAPLQLKNTNSGSVNTHVKLEFMGVTANNQGATPYIQSVHGTDAGGSNSANDAGFEFHTRNGGSGTDTMCMHMSHDAKVGIGTITPEQRLDVVDGNIQIKSTHAKLFLTDSNDNPDWSVENENGIFRIKDQTSNQSRLTINSGGEVNISNKVFLNGGLDTDGDVQFNTGTTNSNILFDASAGALEFTDGNKAVFGTGNDLEIYHDASANINKMHSQKSIENRVKNYYIYTNHHATAHESIMAYGGGQVELTHAGTKKFETTSSGVTVTGEVTSNTLTLSSNAPRITFTDLNNNPDFEIHGNSGALTFYDATNTANRLIIQSDGTVDVQGNLDANGGLDVTGAITATDHVSLNADSKMFRAGASNDLRMYHTGTDSYVDSVTGHLILLNHNTSGKDVILGVGGNYKWRINSDGHFRPHTDSQVDLGTNTIRVRNGYFDTLYGDGSNLTGISSVGGSTGVDFNDNVKARFGTGNDLEIFHQSSDNLSRIHSSDRALKINTSNSHAITLQTNDKNAIVCNPNGAVNLYHNDTKVAQTGTNGLYTYKSGQADIRIGSSDGGGAAIYLDGDSNGDISGSDYAYIRHNTSGDLEIVATNPSGNSDIKFFVGNATLKARFDDGGNFRPETNNDVDLGNSNKRWRNIYTNDLNLSNKGSSNEMDGTWGDWTIQEGESDLFLKNNRSGKKYKFNLTEVS